MKRWFALLPDFVLYSFRNDAESSAVTATPMPGYGVAYGPAELKADSAVSSDQKDKTVSKTRALTFDITTCSNLT